MVWWESAAAPDREEPRPTPGAKSGRQKPGQSESNEVSGSFGFNPRGGFFGRSRSRSLACGANFTRRAEFVRLSRRSVRSAQPLAFARLRSELYPPRRVRSAFPPVRSVGAAARVRSALPLAPGSFGLAVLPGSFGWRSRSGSFGRPGEVSRGAAAIGFRLNGRWELYPIPAVLTTTIETLRCPPEVWRDGVPAALRFWPAVFGPERAVAEPVPASIFINHEGS
jgi:hypothetical protein